MSPFWKRVARRSLRGTAKVWLRWRSRPLAFAAGERIVVLAPHPDDEALGCAGLIMAALARGAAVHIVYVTDGRHSHPGHPRLTPSELARQRSAEAQAAAALLGLPPQQLVFLDVPDGTLAGFSSEQGAHLARRLAAEFDRIGAQTLVLPCRFDASSEHDAVFRFVRQALAMTSSQPRLLEYPIWAWWNPLPLRRPLFASRRIWRIDLGAQRELKRRVIACHRSQVEPLAPWAQPLLSAEFVAAFSSRREYFFET